MNTPGPAEVRRHRLGVLNLQEHSRNFYMVPGASCDIVYLGHEQQSKSDLNVQQLSDRSAKLLETCDVLAERTQLVFRTSLVQRAFGAWYGIFTRLYVKERLTEQSINYFEQLNFADCHLRLCRVPTELLITCITASKISHPHVFT